MDQINSHSGLIAFLCMSHILTVMGDCFSIDLLHKEDFNFLTPLWQCGHTEVRESNYRGLPQNYTKTAGEVWHRNDWHNSMGLLKFIYCTLWKDFFLGNMRREKLETQFCVGTCNTACTNPTHVKSCTYSKLGAAFIDKWVPARLLCVYKA